MATDMIEALRRGGLISRKKERSARERIAYIRSLKKKFKKAVLQRNTPVAAELSAKLRKLGFNPLPNGDVLGGNDNARDNRGGRC